MLGYSALFPTDRRYMCTKAATRLPTTREYTYVKKPAFQIQRRYTRIVTNLPNGESFSIFSLLRHKPM